MSAPPPVAVRGSLVNRVKAILTQPKSEWQVIDGEPATVCSIYMGYIVPLALIPAICGAFGSHGSRPAIASATRSRTTSSHLISPFVLALVIDALRRRSEGKRIRPRRSKSPRMQPTALDLGRLPIDTRLWDHSTLVGLDSTAVSALLGLPVLMKSPQDRAMGYTVVTIIAEIVVWWVLIVLLAGLALGGSALGYGGLYR